MVDAIISLERTRVSHGWDVEDVGEAVASASELKIAEKDRGRFADFFTRLLEVPALQHAAKAQTLASAHERILHTSRILTDLRPIFEDEVGNQPVGALVVHSVRFTAFTADRSQDLHFALDEKDLRTLRDDIDRALAKGDVLRRLMHEQGLPIHVLNEGD